MAAKLSQKDIQESIKNEQRQAHQGYKDELDVTIDRLVDLYAQKQLDQNALRLLIAFSLFNLTKKTLTDLAADVVKRDMANIYANESNKMLLVNYSKRSYA